MRIGVAVLLLSALLSPAALAQQGRLAPGRALALGDSLLRAFDTPAAIDAYRRGLEADPRHASLLRKTAHALSARTEETAGRRGDGPLHEEAVRLARRAVESERRNARGHAILAVVLGRYADWLARERRLVAAATVVELGRESYRHADRAIVLDSGDYVAWAFLGVMHRRLATVPGVVRVIAASFLDWPDVSLEQSERHLVKAVRLEPNEVSTRLELARTYRAMGREADARRQLQAALVVQPRDRLDWIQSREARKLLRESD